MVPQPFWKNTWSHWWKIFFHSTRLRLEWSAYIKLSLLMPKPGMVKMIEGLQSLPVFIHKKQGVVYIDTRCFSHIHAIIPGKTSRFISLVQIGMQVGAFWHNMKPFSGGHVFWQFRKSNVLWNAGDHPVGNHPHPCPSTISSYHTPAFWLRDFPIQIGLFLTKNVQSNNCWLPLHYFQALLSLSKMLQR